MAQSQNSSSLLDTTHLASLKGARIALVYTEWNDDIVQKQLEGCKRILDAHNATVVREIVVPGSFEIPFGCNQLWDAYQDRDDAPEAIITFGAVIRGGTPHFEYVCKAVTEGVVHLNMMLPIPVIFGVLTLDNEQQAVERLGGPHGHKGEEAAITALKMISNSRALADL